MICPFCNKDINKRSSVWQGFFCDDCETCLHTTSNVDPETNASSEVLYCVAFYTTFNNERYQILYFSSQDKTVIHPPANKSVEYIEPDITLNFLSKKEPITIKGQPLNPKNVKNRLPTIITFL